MTNEVFIDTNVLVYAFTEAGRRSVIAERSLSSGGSFSVQVANEFVDVMRRKFGWPLVKIVAALDQVRSLLGPPLASTEDTHRLALDICARYGFRIYDGLVVAGAKSAGCRILLTEDLTHGQVVDGVRIENPFLT